MTFASKEVLSGVSTPPRAALGEVRTGLLRLHNKTDDFFSAVIQRHLPRMACAPGCASCCGRMPSVFPVEAWIIAELMREEPEALDHVVEALLPHRNAQEVKPCVMLSAQGRCRIYDARPIICRSHGAPIRVPGRTIQGFDVCPLNFSEPGQRALVAPEDILDVERLNEILAVVDNLFRQGYPGGEILPVRMPLAHGVLHFLDEDL